MNSKFFKVALATVFLTVALVGCASDAPEGDEDIALDGGSQAAPDDNGMAPKADVSAEGGGDAFADFDAPANGKEAAAAPAPSAADQALLQQTPPAAGGADDDLSLDAPAPKPAAPPVVENSNVPDLKDLQAPTAPEATQAPVVETPSPAPVSIADNSPKSNLSGTSEITGVKYKANDNGGTVIIEGSGPLTFTTRKNPELHQLVVEVPDAILPRRLQRPLNTRDMQGSIGAIDPYQHSGSNIARFVVQLREGSPDPLVQQEGNSILIVSNPGQSADAGADLSSKETPVNVDLNATGILASQSLGDFLSGNTKFYGKKISMEVNNMDIRDALRFITEESGVNMIIADDVKGALSLKLRQVPWDQALVMIMRAKQLGYTRQGNVLRITTLAQLKAEEDDANKSALAKIATEPLKIRMFQISYAQVDEMEKRVAGFLSTRGKATGDKRTNSLVVTDIEDNIQRIAKVIQGLDTQPPQVLIEGKIVEATEDFQRSIGVNWGFNGGDIGFGRSKSGPVNLHPSFQQSPGTLPQAGLFNITFGTLDVLGDLTAALSLYEQDNRAKVLSSPRIATLTNETANINQTQELPVKTLTLNNGVQQTTVSYKPLVLKLEVTPQITADASIIMKVNVKREFAGATDPATQSFATNGREATTRILVKNNQTAVIGGIYTNDSQDAETGVPWLKDIPILGSLFKATTTNKSHSELLIFLTPRILAQIEGSKPAPTETGGDF